ncbi:MAG: prenyltransferase, partial [Gammaproteobacteria bacterium]|nr:prenyltransferase [Gammaproteobacteria bacterium]
MRPSFLILTPACVFLGLSTALNSLSTLNDFVFFLILMATISAHISVNTLNEYFDFKSGLDLKTRKTPFSGGSGALSDQPEMAQTVLIIGLISLMLTIVTGIYLLIGQGNQIMPIGIIGIVLIVTYTQ